MKYNSFLIPESKSARRKAWLMESLMWAGLILATSSPFVGLYVHSRIANLNTSLTPGEIRNYNSLEASLNGLKRTSKLIGFISSGKDPYSGRGLKIDEEAKETLSRTKSFIDDEIKDTQEKLGSSQYKQYEYWKNEFHEAGKRVAWSLGTLLYLSGSYVALRWGERRSRLPENSRRLKKKSNNFAQHKTI